MSELVMNIQNKSKCKDCVAPKRHIGCHSVCEDYIQEKFHLEKKKKQKRKYELGLRGVIDFWNP